MIGYVLCGLFFGAIGFVTGWACDWFFGDKHREPKSMQIEEKDAIGNIWIPSSPKALSDEQIQHDYDENKEEEDANS